MTVRTLSMEEFVRDPSLANGKEPVALTQDGRTVKILVDTDCPEKALAAWRAEQDLATIQEGIADFEAGRFDTFENVAARLRAKHAL